MSKVNGDRSDSENASTCISRTSFSSNNPAQRSMFRSRGPHMKLYEAIELPHRIDDCVVSQSNWSRLPIISPGDLEPSTTSATGGGVLLLLSNENSPMTG